jgi:cysteine synthase A
MDGHLDIFVAGIGTAGTIVGAAEYLKKKLPRLRAVGVVSVGCYFSETPGEGAYIEGISPDFLPEIYRSEFVDEVVEIPFETALENARKLMRLEGIPGGISSGATVAAAALEYARNPEASIVTVLPDSARNYPTTLLKKDRT